ncbi:unnamed protein product [Owenia fusiformis]|uniref:Aminotransferase class I/classII large domain-containing protein n=1 Tax=Owenia fusiformis TaxID=6347 RepID=A0A8J1UXT7_OWEFU|nr:unnamed protein product [Owenia fusiformis]
MLSKSKILMRCIGKCSKTAKREYMYPSNTSADVEQIWDADYMDNINMFDSTPDLENGQGKSAQTFTLDFTSSDPLDVAKSVANAENRSVMTSIGSGNTSLKYRLNYGPDSASSLQCEVEEKSSIWLQSECTVMTPVGKDPLTTLVDKFQQAKSLPVYIDALARLNNDIAGHTQNNLINFNHNEIESLFLRIKEHGPGLVVIQSVYGKTGTIAPLEKMCQLTRELDCTLIVDETNALAVYGEEGAGKVAELDLHDFIPYRIARLPALGSNLGLITCFKSNVDTLREPLNVGIDELDRLLLAIEHVKENAWARDLLRSKSKYLKDKIIDMGYPGIHLHHPSHIFGLCIGDTSRVNEISNFLKSCGVNTEKHTHPSVPEYRDLLQWKLNVTKSTTQLNNTVDILREMLDKRVARPWNWPDAFKRPRLFT